MTNAELDAKYLRVRITFECPTAGLGTGQEVTWTAWWMDDDPGEDDYWMAIHHGEGKTPVRIPKVLISKIEEL